MVQKQLDILAKEGIEFCQQLVAVVSHTSFSPSYLTINFHWYVFFLIFPPLCLLYLPNKCSFQGLDPNLSFLEAAISLLEWEEGSSTEKRKFILISLPPD